jgi:hypothetical protein
VVVAAELHDTQTAKWAFGGDVLADSVKAPKLLKQIFSKGRKFTAIEQSGQNRGILMCPFTTKFAGVA